jgi:hypothetical protein
MKSHSAVRLFRILGTTGILCLTQACATTDYTTHYGMFEAENSAGEWRQFRIYWQTVHTEGWAGTSDRVLPVVLEAQCSQRRLMFFDQSFPRNRQCRNAEEGVHYCGESGQDVNWRGEAISDGQVCATLTDYKGSSRIGDLSGDIMLTVRCRPKVLQRQQIDTKVNLDYLLASEIPYTIATKKVEGGGRNVDAYLPELFNHSSVCDPDS